MGVPQRATRKKFDATVAKLYVIPAAPGYQAIELIFGERDKDGNYTIDDIQMWPVIAWKIVCTGDIIGIDEKWRGSAVEMCEDVETDLAPIIVDPETTIHAILSPDGRVTVTGVAEYDTLGDYKRSVIGKSDEAV